MTFIQSFLIILISGIILEFIFNGLARLVLHIREDREKFYLARIRNLELQLANEENDARKDEAMIAFMTCHDLVMKFKMCIQKGSFYDIIYTRTKMRTLKTVRKTDLYHFNIFGALVPEISEPEELRVDFCEIDGFEIWYAIDSENKKIIIAEVDWRKP